MLMQAAWRKPEQWRLLFHCFSNTGWYTFGAVMEGLLKRAATLLQHVIGSVIDSAPHAEVSHPGSDDHLHANILRQDNVLQQ